MKHIYKHTNKIKTEEAWERWEDHIDINLLDVILYINHDINTVSHLGKSDNDYKEFLCVIS